MSRNAHPASLPRPACGPLPAAISVRGRSDQIASAARSRHRALDLVFDRIENVLDPVERREDPATPHVVVTGMPSRKRPISALARHARARRDAARFRKPQVPLMVWTSRKDVAENFGVVRLLLKSARARHPPYRDSHGSRSENPAATRPLTKAFCAESSPAPPRSTAWQCVARPFKIA